MQIIKIPSVKITPNRITFYESTTHTSREQREKLEYYIGNDDEREEISKEKTNRQHFGALSDMGRRNLVKSCSRFTYFLNLSNETKRQNNTHTKKSLKFVTLTLASPQIHTDTEIRHMLLNHFLTELRQKFGLENYVWKAEKQENQNLHFHVLIDIFIDHRKIREIWNRIQNKLGYIERFRAGIKQKGFEYYYEAARKNNKYISTEQILERWQKGERENWKQPPGTEIKQVARIKKASAYFAKYFSKEDKIEAGFGRIWYASRNVSRYPILKMEESAEAGKLYHYLWKNFKSRAFVNLYCLSYGFDLIKLNRLYPTTFIGEYICRCLDYSHTFD